MTRQSYFSPQTWTNFTYSPTEWNEEIVSNLEEVGDYIPPWFYHPILAGFQIGKSSLVDYDRESLADGEGGQIDIDWLPHRPFKTSNNSEENICLHFPGVGSTSNSKASRNFAIEMVSRGFRCAVINPRGSCSPLQTSRLWHGGFHFDALLLLKHIAAQADGASSTNKAANLLLVGYSASTNILKGAILELLAQRAFGPLDPPRDPTDPHSRFFYISPHIRVVGIVAVSPTYDYRVTRDAAERTWTGTLLSLFLTSRYKSALRNHPQIHNQLDQKALQLALGCSYVSQWDSVAWPLLGYRSEEEQYRCYSSLDMSEMRVPFLAVQPQDDILHADNLAANCPLEKYMGDNSHILYMLCSHGSHLAFVEGSDRLSYIWPAKVSCAFFRGVLDGKRGGNRLPADGRESRRSQRDDKVQATSGGGKSSAVTAVMAAFCFRLLLVLLGTIIDSQLVSAKLHLQYTDVDYHVFSDAALLLARGLSPYGRQGFKYPPALAALLVPNHFMFPEFGKVLFSAFDAAIAYLIYIIGVARSQRLQSRSEESAVRWSWIWALNPFSAVICTRGSSDSISNALILCTVYCALSRSVTLCGVAFGLAVHLRMYPVIYFPALIVYLASNSGTFSVRNGAYNAVKFLVITLFTIACCTAVSCAAIGPQYLSEAVLYHVGRADPRHNFSLHFYRTYLEISYGLSGAHASYQQNDIFGALYARCAPFLPFLPQLVLIMCTAALARRELELCLLVQTIIFVAFNKVCTAQYFTWYITFLPIVLLRCVDAMHPQLRVRWVRVGFWIATAWIVSLAAWLWRAHSLEMQGKNAFTEVWQCSLLVHIVQCIAAAALIRISRAMTPPSGECRDSAEKSK